MCINNNREINFFLNLFFEIDIGKKTCLKCFVKEYFHQIEKSKCFD